MNLKSRNKLQIEFSLASMTDIVFQLLLFFMLTSSFINPAALPINLPSSVQAPTITPKVQITITTDLQYFVNDNLVENKKNIADEIAKALAVSKEKGIVLLNIDKDVAVEHLVEMASLLNTMGLKVSIATKVESKK
jgi:biopolymer transport protein ExbD